MTTGSTWLFASRPVTKTVRGTTVRVATNQMFHISVWFTSNRQALNIDKTQAIIFFWDKVPLPNSQVKLKDQRIANISGIKVIWVIVDKKLNSKGHISFVGDNLSNSCRILNNNRNVDVGQKSLVTQPYLFISVLIFKRVCFYLNKNSSPVIHTHKRVIRALSHLAYVRTLSLFIIGSLSLCHIINFSGAVFIHKALNQLTKTDIDFFIWNYLCIIFLTNAELLTPLSLFRKPSILDNWRGPLSVPPETTMKWASPASHQNPLTISSKEASRALSEPINNSVKVGRPSASPEPTLKLNGPTHRVIRTH